MAVINYKTFTFTNDTGQQADGLKLRFTGSTEIVSVDGKPPEGKGHGDYSVIHAGTLSPAIQDIVMAARGRLRVRVKGNISLQARQCYWTKDGKKLKPLKIPDNLFVTTSPQTDAASSFKVRKLQ